MVTGVYLRMEMGVEDKVVSFGEETSLLSILYVSSTILSYYVVIVAVHISVFSILAYSTWTDKSTVNAEFSSFALFLQQLSRPNLHQLPIHQVVLLSPSAPILLSVESKNRFLHSTYSIKKNGKYLSTSIQSTTPIKD